MKEASSEQEFYPLALHAVKLSKNYSAFFDIQEIVLFEWFIQQSIWWAKNKGLKEFYQSAKDISDQTKIKKSKLAAIIDKFIKLGIVTTEVKYSNTKFANTTFYSITKENKEAIIGLVPTIFRLSEIGQTLSFFRQTLPENGQTMPEIGQHKEYTQEDTLKNTVKDSPSSLDVKIEEDENKDLSVQKVVDENPGILPERPLEVTTPRSAAPPETNSKYTPPTEEEVEEYFSENGSDRAEAQNFYREYSQANWFNKVGHKMFNWQKTAHTWIKYEKAQAEKLLHQSQPIIQKNDSSAAPSRTANTKTSGSDTLHQSAIAVFTDFYSRKFNTQYIFSSGKDGTAVKQLILKIGAKTIESGSEANEESLLAGFKVFLESITDVWVLNNLSPSMLNSKFNELFTSAKNGPQREESHFEMRYRQMKSFLSDDDYDAAGKRIRDAYGNPIE